MFIKIEGIKSSNNMLIGNIPICTLNKLHKIYFVHPETN